MAATESPKLDSIERVAWEMSANSLKADHVAYFWSQVMRWAEGKIGLVAYRGEVWYKRVVELAEWLLTELGIAWEMYAGQRYILGKRVYWNSNKSRWEQDDWR